MEEGNGDCHGGGEWSMPNPSDNWLLRAKADLTPAIIAKAIAKRLKKILGPGVMVSATTDPTLIAGLTLRFDDTMIDASARRLLGEMKDTILSAPVGANLWSE